MTTPKPFKIDVSQDLLDWITQRIQTTRIPPGKKTLAASNSVAEQWSFGLPPDVATKIHKEWRDNYDWRKVEAELNRELKQFTIPIRDGDEGAEEETLDIHFVHNRSNNKDAIPLLFLHGWPGSFLEVRPIIDKLTTPSSPNDQAYHVVAPSLPGYGFSSYPSAPCSPMRSGRIMDKLMKALGYNKYILQGGDWGSLIGRTQAHNFPDSCVALHINMVMAMPPEDEKDPMANLTERQKALVGRLAWWREEESGYSAIQGTKPQTISYALTDSPFGMMCWLRCKLHPLVDDDFTWGEEEVITWAMPYIINGTPGHAEIYKWLTGARKDDLWPYLFKPITKKVAVGCSLFPKDVCYCPKSWADRQIGENIVFWGEHEKGGHFASVEKPNELVADIRAFTDAIDEKTLAELKQQG